MGNESKQVSVKKLSELTASTDDEQNKLTTLDAVFSSSRYVIFYLLNSVSTRSLELVVPLKRFVQERNKSCLKEWNPTPEELFQGAVLRSCKGADGIKHIVTESFKNLNSTVKGLYFGANWCPPCRTFEQHLISCYESLKNAGVPFEIFFCSSDRSQESFEQHFLTMPWLAFPYDQQKTIQLTRLYSLSGIPALLILNEKNSIISKHGRNVLLSDPSGSLFPWGPLPVYELNENTLCKLRDEPSLVLFTEGSPEDITFSVEVLRSTADSLFRERQELMIRRSSSKESDTIDTIGSANGNADSSSSNLAYSTNSVDSSVSSDISLPPWIDSLQIFYTGEDPLCDYMLEGLGLGNAELPVIVILDATVGRMSVCEKPDVSAEIISEFVADYKSGKLNMVPLPTAHQKDSQPTRFGGIPAQAVQFALGIGHSSSSTSFSVESSSPTTHNVPVL
ncbi:unnamed protein product [Thelazia callipaeda]|uniref:Thioredoxin domain-containing protein n=1 Tax=Thelazia callipaeda TaxID=103827 RepID=A0A0N5DBC9_THECL|nr:unnamed protein product [Thelazia callipaeda]